MFNLLDEAGREGKFNKFFIFVLGANMFVRNLKKYEGYQIFTRVSKSRL